MKRYIIIVLLGVFGLIKTSIASNESDILRIRKQYIDILLKSIDVEKAANYQQQLSDDGTWSTINYLDNRRSGWATRNHMHRIREMAKVYLAPETRLSGNADLKQAITKALNHWNAKNYRCGNWWYNKIDVPAVAVDILILMGDDIPVDTRETTIKTIVNQAKMGMTGQNSVWLAEIVLVRSLLQHDSSLLKQARDTILRELQVTTKEGIQPDWSFHQHGPQQQFGNYGRAFAGCILKWGEILHGTSMALSPRQLEIFRHYILDGYTWIIWKGRMDLSGCGRQLSRDCQIKKGKSTETMLKRLVEIDPDHREQYMQRLASTPSHDINAFVGNRPFWRSDMMVHRRPHWYASVKMSSKRVVGAETCNSENLLGMHLGDGAFFVYRTGDEYSNIQGVWDWHRLPGTTCDQTIARLLPGNAKCKLPTVFVGSVSDGQTGLAVLDYKRDALSAKKAWFFLADRIVCLGAGITSDGGGPILTSIQQSLLQGPVSGKNGPIRTGSHSLARNDWVYHAGIGYHILEGADVVLEIATQTGNWKRLFANWGEATPESKDVFNLWIDHGKMPNNRNYAYVMYPESTIADMQELNQLADMRVLQNTSQIQAIAATVDGKVCIGVVFHEPGQLSLGNHLTVKTDTPCLLLMSDSQKKLFIAEPTQKQAGLQLTVNGKPYSIELPKAGNAGQTIAVTLN